MSPGRDGIRALLRWLLALAYGYAGYRHLATPAPFLAITPEWVPQPEFVVAATGVAELAGALGLMIPQTRKAAGWGLALASSATPVAATTNWGCGTHSGVIARKGAGVAR